MTLEKLLNDLRARVAKLEEAAQSPGDSLLWLRAKDVETTAMFIARKAADMEPNVELTGDRKQAKPAVGRPC